MILVQAKGQEKLCSKNTSFYSCAYCFCSYLYPVVDQHPIATTDDESIEDVDPVAPDVNSVALDVAMDIPLRRSERAHRLVVSYDYIVYLQEHEYDAGDVSDPTTYKEVIVSP